MVQTNEYERDLNDTAFLRRPGRVDFRVFQNIPDCGDGHPGLQRCFRNYLHEGGMEKDLQLVGHGIKGTSVDINNAELQQLSNIGNSLISNSEWEQIANIGAATILGAQWGYVGNMDQEIHKGHSPEFVKGIFTQATGTPPFTISSTTKVTNLNVDKVDGYDLDQGVKQADSPTFGGLTLNGNIVMAANNITFTTGLVDGVDISAFKTDYDATFGIGSGNAQTIGCIWEGDNTHGTIFRQARNYFVNDGGFDDTILYFAIPLTCDKGSYSLKLDSIFLKVITADSNDYIGVLDIYGFQDDGTEDLLYLDDTDRTSPGTYTYDLSNIDCSGYWKLVIEISANLTSTSGIGFYAPILKYFYS